MIRKGDYRDRQAKRVHDGIREAIDAYLRGGGAVPFSVEVTDDGIVKVRAAGDPDA